MSATQQPPSDRMPVATAMNATKIYGEGDTQVKALDEVNVAFIPGQFAAVMGPSGSGKSTLMHTMAGLDRLTSGEVKIGNTSLNSLSDKDLTLLRRTQVGFVFQAYNLIPTLTAGENITLPEDLGGNKPDKAWLDAVVDAVGLGDRLHHRPSELSGGQQQRVAVARALVGRPDIVFADEPTGNLDSRSGHEILSFLRRAVDDLDQSIVMVTHDPQAASYTDRVVVLTDGKIVHEMQQPDANDVYNYMRDLGA